MDRSAANLGVLSFGRTMPSRSPTQNTYGRQDVPRRLGAAAVGFWNLTTHEPPYPPRRTSGTLDPFTHNTHTYPRHLIVVCSQQAVCRSESLKSASSGHCVGCNATISPGSSVSRRDHGEPRTTLTDASRKTVCGDLQSHQTAELTAEDDATASVMDSAGRFCTTASPCRPCRYAADREEHRLDSRRQLAAVFNGARALCKNGANTAPMIPIEWLP
ncbi:hypothetical protein BDP55DRAFT_756805 [Colletotrichum godetiae]|uniref:Uncharacterized protein n=1 Tax=Colletotrichum godetiae TaxID=1209918 RepID=A0AAJ0A9V9_9PEZI|nr:uncharacterized protein BDP55DRAFT_756805 [Colletotrichum godetiae]KAK1659214.1 hypothetical protein BDP55DRAFT_756805 [Colletotrichum godetiae]